MNERKLTAGDAMSRGEGPDTALMDSAYSSFYGDVYRTHWWWRAREANVVRVLRKFFIRPAGPAKILDIGCGDGFIWPRLVEFGEVEGIEPDPVLVPHDSLNRPRIEFAGLLEGRDRPGEYDMVLMLDVLEHIEDEQAALDRVATLLTENGTLMLTVPALPVLWSEFDTLSGHFRRYSKKSLRATLARSGLHVTYLRYTYAWTVLPLFARRLFFRADAAETSHFVKPPMRALNVLLHLLSLLDHAVTRRVPMPFGSSLTAVAVRPPSADAKPRPRSRGGADTA